MFNPFTTIPTATNAGSVDINADEVKQMLLEEI